MDIFLCHIGQQRRLLYTYSVLIENRTYFSRAGLSGSLWYLR